MSNVLTTEAVSPRERLAYWIDMISSTYVPLECEPEPCPGFGGSIRTDRLPDLDFTVIRSGPQRVQRTARAIARDCDDYCLFSLQTRGKAIVSQDGRRSMLLPGDIALYESTRPYALDLSEDFEEVVLRIRSDRLRALVRNTEELTATTISGSTGAGHLLAGMVRGLRDQIGSLGSEAVGVVGGVVNLLAAGLQALPAGRRVELSSIEAYHLARIRGAIDRRLQEPGLTLGAVAEELGISTGHLHRLFKHELLSASEYLWSQRLEACGRTLADPMRGKSSIARIAFEWGFNDAAHFSRAFRERFDCSPTEWRRRAIGLERAAGADASVR